MEQQGAKILRLLGKESSASWQVATALQPMMVWVPTVDLLQIVAKEVGWEQWLCAAQESK